MLLCYVIVQPDGQETAINTDTNPPPVFCTFIFKVANRRLVNVHLPVSKMEDSIILQ